MPILASRFARTCRSEAARSGRALQEILEQMRLLGYM